MLSSQLLNELEHIIENKDKKIERIKANIKKWQVAKKACPKAYDPELCISRYNQMIQDAKNKIKKLQGRPVKPLPVYGPYKKK